MLVGAVLAIAGFGGRASAQSVEPSRMRATAADTAAARSSLRGLVIDAANDRPIVAARVTLFEIAADRSSPGCEQAFARGRRAGTSLTDTTGAYLFAGLTPGDYTLCVRALGYRPRALRITLEPAVSQRVHVGLPSVPAMLAPVRVTRTRDDLFATGPVDGVSNDSRAGMERVRQARYLTSDARLLTSEDVSLAAGVGELDLLRALQQLPGVTARDDYTSAPWTRGAPADQTAVLFDGLPLLNPYHGVGAISGVNTEAIGNVAFHPGVAPTELTGGAAGILDLRSRRATAPGVHGSIGASGIAASGRIEGMTHDARASGAIAVRRSHLDLTNGWAAHIGADGARALPYAFDDAVARGDLALSDVWRLEGSALLSHDRLWAPVSGIVDGATGHWGGRAARLALHRSMRGGEILASIGTSATDATLRADTDALLDPAGVPRDSNLYTIRDTIFRPQPIDSRAEVRLATVSWHDASDSAGLVRSSLGVDVAAWRTSFSTEGPWPHSAQFIDTVTVRTSTAIATLWGERLWQPSATLTVRTGARLDLGPALRNAPSARLAPRLTLRYRPSTSTSFSLAAGATHQYAQALAPPGPGRNAVATTNALWVVADSNIPMLASRIATLGAEHWFTRSVLASATAYWRDDIGVLLSDPRAGYLVDRPLAAEGRGRASGLETSVRSLGARWNGSLSYALGKSTLSAYDLSFAAPSERPWVARAQTSMSVLRRTDGVASVRVGLAWEAAAGPTFTRYHGSVARCDAAQRCRWEPPPRIEAPSGERGSATQRLDASVSGAWATRSLLIEGYLQIRNLTRAANEAAYVATVGRCAEGTQAEGTCHPELSPQTFEDTRLPPLRGWLGVGFRVSQRSSP